MCPMLRTIIEDIRRRLAQRACEEVKLRCLSISEYKDRECMYLLHLFLFLLERDFYPDGTPKWRLTATEYMRLVKEYRFVYECLLNKC